MKASCFLAQLAAFASVPANAAVVKCTFEDNSEAIYKIDASSWMEWDAKDWKWQDRTCPKPEGWAVQEPGQCKISIDENLYSFAQKSIQDDHDGIPPYYPNHIWEYKLSIDIDRAVGKITRKWSQINIFNNSTIRNERWVQLILGSCVAAKDPALMPKPAPKL